MQAQAIDLETGRKTFHEMIFNPKEFSKLCQEADDMKLDHFINTWLESSDTETLEKIIEMYLDGRYLAGYILSRAINIIQGKKDAYFKMIFKRLSSDDSMSGFHGGYIPNIAERVDAEEDPHKELKMKSLRCWHAQVAAIKRIEDKEFLESIVRKVPAGCDFAYESPQAIALSRTTNQGLFKKIIRKSKDSFLVSTAIAHIKDRRILRRFARLTDKACDQYGFEFKSVQQHKAFNRLGYRRVARKRLKKLR